MLNEAVLDVFAADLPTARPFEANTLRWDVTMPTTVIPGVVPILELSVGPNGHVDGLSAAGSRPAKQRSATTYALSIIAPKASCTKPASTSQPGTGTQPPVHPTDLG
jgi:hypothetical protein